MDSQVIPAQRTLARKSLRISSGSIGFTLLLAAMAALPPLSIDFYLSTLSVIGRSLGSSATAAGYTVSIFLGSFALSQLVFGPLSDRVGRRPVGIFGCALFTIAGLGCSTVHSMALLLFCRLLQGVGAGAVTVLAFAVVRDSFSGTAASVKFAYVNATMAFVPMIAPVLGSLVYKVAGWRCVMAVVGVLGLALTAVFSLGFEESLSDGKRTGLSVEMLARNYFKVVSNRSVLGYCLLTAFTFGTMLAYVTSSSFVFIDLIGITRTHFGIILFFTASGIVAGSSLSGMLSARNISYRNILASSLLLNLMATGALLTLSLTDHFTIAAALPLIMLTTLSVGLTTPNAAHGALAPMGNIAGTAAAMLGALRMLGGSVASASVSFFPKPGPTSMTAVMALFSLLAAGAYTIFVRPSDQLQPWNAPEIHNPSAASK